MATTVVDNTITHNIVTGGAIVMLTGFDYSSNGQSFNGATVKHTLVRDNTVLSAPGAGIEAGILGDHHEMTDVTLAGNTVVVENRVIGNTANVIQSKNIPCL